MKSESSCGKRFDQNVQSLQRFAWQARAAGPACGWLLVQGVMWLALTTSSALRIPELQGLAMK